MGTSALAGELGMAAAMTALDEIMARHGVSSKTREYVINASEMMYQYIPYALAQNKNPADGKVLADFIRTKGQHMVKFLGNEGLNCGIAIVDFFMSVRQASYIARGGYPPLIAIAYGLALLDLIEVGNSCEFAQQAYYEAFLRESAVKLRPVRRSVEQFYSAEKLICVMP